MPAYSSMWNTVTCVQSIGRAAMRARKGIWELPVASMTLAWAAASAMSSGDTATTTSSCSTLKRRTSAIDLAVGLGHDHGDIGDVRAAGHEDEKPTHGRKRGHAQEG